MTLTLNQFRAIAPDTPADRVLEFHSALQGTFCEFGINTPARVSAFLAQAVHESQQFTRLRENVNYTWRRILAVWPSRFGQGRNSTPRQRVEGEVLAKRLEHNPSALANHVYALRGGNRDAGSGDGYRYRGGGIFHLTFLDNYLRCGRAMGVDLVNKPELIETPVVACRSAGWYWDANGLNVLADPDTESSFLAISRAINLGDPKSKEAPQGWEDRLRQWHKVKQILRG